MRPTGALHLGHLTGALDNWVRLQDEYECYYSIVDWHALTTDYATPEGIAQNVLEVGTDWLAAGLDPARSTLFIQSLVPEHAELHLLLSMVVPVPWLERVPSYKDSSSSSARRTCRPTGSSATRCCRAPTSWSTRPPRCRWVRIRRPTSR